MTTAERLRQMVAEHFDVKAEKVTDETRFFEDLNADSLDPVELVMNAEETFDIHIDDDEMAKLLTFGDARRLVEDRVKDRAPA